MLKFFRKSDIVNTDFTVSTDKTADNVIGDLLAGVDSSGSIFSVNIFGDECDDSKSGSCAPNTYLSSLKTYPSELNISHQYGKFIHSSSVFYDVDDDRFNIESNPINTDGSYKRQVYNTIKKSYYNNYNNGYNIFGFDTFDTSNTSLNLSDEFVLLNFKTTDSGDRIRATSISVNNQSGDIVSSLIDDGYNNLKLSGTFFINKYTFKPDNKDNIFSYGDCGVSQLINGNVTLPVAPDPTPAPTPPPTYYYAIFTSCDTSGSLLYVSSSNIITGSSVIYDSTEDRCYTFSITGGNGSDGNVLDYTGYSNCSTCETAHTPTIRYHFLFESCDTSGSLLEVWSGSLVQPDLTIYNSADKRCYVSKSFGGDGSDGNISTYTQQYTDCDACELVYPPPARYHRLFVSCNGDGSTLKLKSNIGTVPTGLTIYNTNDNKCYIYSSVGGDGSDGDISNYPVYADCGTCEISGAITVPISQDPVVIVGTEPTPAPVGTPETGTRDGSKDLIPTCVNPVRVYHETLNTAPYSTVSVSIKSLLINSDPEKNPNGSCESTVYVSGMRNTQGSVAVEYCDETGGKIAIVELGYLSVSNLVSNGLWTPDPIQDIADFATFTYHDYYWTTPGVNGAVWCDDPETAPTTSGVKTFTYSLSQFLELVETDWNTATLYLKCPWS